MALPPPPPKQLKVRLPENEGVARCLHEKRLSVQEQTGGLKVNLDRTFAKAYRNVCDSEAPIRTLKEFSKIKGVGPWLIRQMREFFGDYNQDLSSTKGKKTRESKCSLPKKNPAAPGKGLSTKVGLSACSSSVIPFSGQRTFELQPSATMVSAELNMGDKKDTPYLDNSIWAMPPRQSNEEFHEAYEVVLVLDDRENFGSHSRKDAARKVADNIHSQCKVKLLVEVKRLPVGDGIWIARHKRHLTEYVLDFIVERKNVADLGSSITDNRYKDQKLRLQKCGLRKLIYLVEGDPNRLNASERIKTACFTTEIHEGFDVLRTSGYADTIKTYSNLSNSIIEYYNTNFSTLAESSRVCPTYDEFERNCHGLKRKTVSQIFALQLMQVPRVTEQVALAVIELYPTLLSLARAYSMLEGDVRAQEEMLKNKSRMVNAGASRNIFKLVWGDGCNLQI